MQTLNFFSKWTDLAKNWINFRFWYQSDAKNYGLYVQKS